MSESTRRPENAGAKAASERGGHFPSDQGPDGNAEAATDLEAGSQPGLAQPENGETMSASEEMNILKQECDELRDQALRARAELVNYQRRAKQQADSDRIYAVGSLARDLLDPIDNLERAIEALRASGASDVTAGLAMVQKHLLEILGKHGVKPIPAQGHPFDPNLHDAVLQQPTLEHPEGIVVAELSKGYTIGDRVLRPSKVAVSAKPPSG